MDVFFIHPTSARDASDWNVAIDNPAAYRTLIERSLPNHAQPFQAAGPLYAPLYRQAALFATFDASEDSDGALDLAYSDVQRAFDSYMEIDNRGRGVIVAGVGQGGAHALRLLADRGQDDAQKERLAAAYIIDAAVPADLKTVGVSQPACTSASQTHCIVAWKSIVAGEGSERSWFLKDAPYWRSDGAVARLSGASTLCVNPMLWTTGDALAPRSDHFGGARVVGDAGAEPKIIAGAVSARCQDGILTIERPSEPELRSSTGWGGRYKTPDFNLFYADIALNAAERSREASVWMDANARKPAKPLPPPTTLPDTPIHRPNGVIDPVE